MGGWTAEWPALVLALAAPLMPADREIAPFVRPQFVTHPIAPIHGPALLLREPLADRGEGWLRYRVLAPALGLQAQPLLEVAGEVEPFGFAGTRALVLRSTSEPKGLLLIELATGRVQRLDEQPEEWAAPLHLSDHGALLFRSDPPHDWHLDGADEGRAWLSLQPADGGAPRVVAQLPKGVERSLLRARVAPDGRHVAWATPWDAGVPGTPGFLEGAALVVVDAASGATVRTWDGIEVAVSPFSSSMATLEFTWLDGRTLRYGDTQFAAGSEGGARPFAGTFRWIDVALDQREVLAAWPVGPMELSHDQPSREREPTRATGAADGATGDATGDGAAPSGRVTLGWFEVDPSRLWFRGDREPAVDARAPVGAERAWFRVSADGEFALLMRENGATTAAILLVGASRERVPLSPGATVLGWFESGPPPTAPRGG